MRQQQVLASVEGVAGTMETLVAGNGGVRIVVGAATSMEWPTEARNLARSTMTHLGHLVSTKSTNINFRSEVNTPDTVTASSEHTTYLRGCGCTVIAAKAINVGTITSGPYARNETITGAGGGTGRVLVAASATRIYYVPIAGALNNSETITGSGGATATSSSAPYDAGWVIKPRSDGQETISLELQEDGMSYSARGCMGNAVATFENSKPGYLDFTFQGPENAVAAKAMTTGITYNTEDPPILQNAAMTINAAVVVSRQAALDFGNTVVNRPDLNAAASGFISAYISGREPKLSISMEMPPVATLPIYTLWSAGTKVPVKFACGTAAGKAVHVFADLAQITGITQGDGDGIRQADVEFTLTGAAAKSDDEWEIVMV
jgi:hypothetical protein